MTHGDQLFPEITLGIGHPGTDKERVTQRRPCPEWRAVSGTQGRAKCEAVVFPEGHGVWPGLGLWSLRRPPHRA